MLVLALWNRTVKVMPAMNGLAVPYKEPVIQGDHIAVADSEPGVISSSIGDLIGA